MGATLAVGRSVTHDGVLLVEEVALAREVHGDAGRLRGLDDLGVAHRAARLHDGASRRRRAAPASPSANGKNASEAATEPARAVTRPADGEVARVDPVDLAHADADRGAARGEQDGVRLDRTAGLPGELEVGQRGVVGVLARRRSCQLAELKPANPSGSWASSPPLICLSSTVSARVVRRAARAGAGSSSSAAARGPRARSPGATSTSVKISFTRLGHAEVTVRFAAITPPKAETGSQACARSVRGRDGVDGATAGRRRCRTGWRA